ncbi:pilus assembly protein TadG-related protein [Photobacterium leiognathi]|uniref:pilus assembly protein TadG-related protein n=1 Tax=Photobacterium leiognathi TaxID=553611 RepID=UPI002981AC89|nr:pilus assembly protein TadG-related protein [Photobacterium leiognathi]
MKKQQGVAAIILVLILIPLFGSVFFALESTRYIQKKTRLADAAEAAALAVTDENPKGLNIAKSELDQKEKLKSYETKSGLANLYIYRYIRNINNNTIMITPTLYINNNDKTLEENPSYYQYNVDVTTTHNSWFYKKIIPSFKEKQNITANSLARNYPKLVRDQPIDLVFVADFSGSMQGDKIIRLKESIRIISTEILSKNKDKSYKNNRIAFVAFSSFISNLNKENKRVRYYKKTSMKCDEYSYDYNHVVTDVYSNYNSDTGKYNFSNSIYDVYNIDYRDTIDLHNRYIREFRSCYFKYEIENIVPENIYFDYSQKITQLKNNGIKEINIFNLESKYIEDIYNKYNFYNIPLNEENIIKKVNNMTPKGSTAAFNGIISGAKLLEKGRGIKNYMNRKKILILLSDGEESDPSILKNLVNNKLCKNIRKNFSTDNNKMFMGMIGIGYQASDNDVFHKCFDENIYNSEHQLISESNIIDVDDLSTLTDKIKELIRKGQQTDGITKLSDGQN